MFGLQVFGKNIPLLMAADGRPACRCINEAAPNLVLIAEETMQVIAFECLIACVCWVGGGDIE